MLSDEEEVVKYARWSLDEKKAELDSFVESVLSNLGDLRRPAVDLDDLVEYVNVEQARRLLRDSSGTFAFGSVMMLRALMQVPDALLLSSYASALLELEIARRRLCWDYSQTGLDDELPFFFRVDDSGLRLRTRVHLCQNHLLRTLIGVRECTHDTDKLHFLASAENAWRYYLALTDTIIDRLLLARCADAEFERLQLSVNAADVLSGGACEEYVRTYREIAAKYQAIVDIIDDRDLDNSVFLSFGACDA